jgi:Ala-tRNA(Pro) deacylase
MSVAAAEAAGRRARVLRASGLAVADGSAEAAGPAAWKWAEAQPCSPPAAVVALRRCAQHIALYAFFSDHREVRMQCKERLEQYLTDNFVVFTEQQHRRAYSAQQIAALEHVPGRQFAKVVMVMADGELAMMVVPAASWLHLDRARSTLGAREVRLASEAEFAPSFPDCEVGAMPPFGNLYDMPVYVDEGLAANDEIVIQAGTHRDTVRMRYADFVRLAEPVVAPLTS